MSVFSVLFDNCQFTCLNFCFLSSFLKFIPWPATLLCVPCFPLKWQDNVILYLSYAFLRCLLKWLEIRSVCPMCNKPICRLQPNPPQAAEQPQSLLEVWEGEAHHAAPHTLQSIDTCHYRGSCFPVQQTVLVTQIFFEAELLWKQKLYKCESLTVSAEPKNQSAVI